MLGVALAVKQFDHSGIFEVAVDPEIRERGVGTELMKLIINTICDVKIAYLQVEIINASAIRVYKKLGFQTLYGYHYRIMEN